MAQALQPKSETSPGWWLLFAAWLLAVSATATSLFFSSVMDLPPCVLCWYQRIALFPLVLVLAGGLFPFDARVVRYALPLAVAGWGVAGYHNLLYAGLLPEGLSPCSQGASCTQRHLELLGFVSIPLLSLLGFSALLALLILVNRSAPR